MTPSLGTVDIDLPRLLETRLLVQANSGGGKSFALRRLLEQTVGHVQQIVIDPEGEFATLREKHDYIVCAPRGADAVATPQTAAALALALWRAGTSAILDVYELKAHERILFVRRFLEALTNAPRDLWHPTLVVIDEAHIFAPQVGSAESLGAVIDLATRGRKRGLALVAATQRISKLHKDVAAETLNKAIGRTGLDVDVKRAADELGLASRDATETLRNLEPGEFFVYGPALSKTVLRTRIGPVETTHPKTGHRALAAPPPPSPKVRAQLAKLEGLQREAVEEERTVEALRTEVANLRRRLTLAEKAQPSGVSDAEVQRRVREALAAVPAPALPAKVQRAVASAIAALQSIEASSAAPPATTGVATPPAAARAPRANGHDHAPRAVPGPVASGVTAPQQRILDSLAALDAFGLPEPEKETLAAHSGVPHTSGGYRNNLSALRTAGLIEYPSPGTAALTAAGRAKANRPTKTPTLQELHESWLRLVSGPQRAILFALLEAWPDSVSKDDLAARCGVPSTSGGYRNNLSRLRTMRAIDYPSPGSARAATVLFPKVSPGREGVR